MRHPFLHVSWNGSSAVVKKLYHRFDRSSTTTTTLYFFSLPIYALPSISKRKKPANRTSNFVFLALRKIAISLNSVFLYRINEIISFFFTYLSEFTLAIKIILVVNSTKHVWLWSRSSMILTDWNENFEKRIYDGRELWKTLVRLNSLKKCALINRTWSD